jgi:hypothetical protein
VGEPCSSFDSCASDAFCDGSVCRARGGADAACAATSQCSPQNYCSAAGTCAPKFPLGAACDPNDFTSCLDSLCTTDGVCVNFGPDLLCQASAG